MRYDSRLHEGPALSTGKASLGLEGWESTQTDNSVAFVREVKWNRSTELALTGEMGHPGGYHLWLLVAHLTESRGFPSRREAPRGHESNSVARRRTTC